jgi:hypothetical protein
LSLACIVYHAKQLSRGILIPGEAMLRKSFHLSSSSRLCRLRGLSAEQLQFVLTFVRCEGRFNRMEDEMGLSYPTLRNRLNEIIRAMGYEPTREEAPAGPIPPGPAERQSILDMLSRGEIDLEEAKRRLRGERAVE